MWPPSREACDPRSHDPRFWWRPTDTLAACLGHPSVHARGCAHSHRCEVGDPAIADRDRVLHVAPGRSASADRSRDHIHRLVPRRAGRAGHREQTKALRPRRCPEPGRPTDTDPVQMVRAALFAIRRASARVAVPIRRPVRTEFRPAANAEADARPHRPRPGLQAVPTDRPVGHQGVALPSRCGPRPRVEGHRGVRTEPPRPAEYLSGGA